MTTDITLSRHASPINITTSLRWSCRTIARTNL